MKRLIIAIPLILATLLYGKNYAVLIKVDKTPPDSVGEDLASLHARVDSLQRAMSEVAPGLGQIIINNSGGTFLGYITDDTTGVPTIRTIAEEAIKAEGIIVRQPEIEKWFEPQEWKRAAESPIVSLGDSSEFDDMHIFGPAVVYKDDQYMMWYCGAQEDKVRRFGLATSPNGVVFTKHEGNPVYEHPSGYSILTPTILRNPDGSVCLENDSLRMWFVSHHGENIVFETASADGVSWRPHTQLNLSGCYAPTVIKENGVYKMWFANTTSPSSWSIGYAESVNGIDWSVIDDSVLVVDQAWEGTLLMYPCVMKIDGFYLMWYGSYFTPPPEKHDGSLYTALGFAVSHDGLTWRKHSDNPVLTPAIYQPERFWESHYVTSCSVSRLGDGSFRIWYASRKDPVWIDDSTYAWENEYFAICTALWEGGPPGW